MVLKLHLSWRQVKICDKWKVWRKAQKMEIESKSPALVLLLLEWQSLFPAAETFPFEWWMLLYLIMLHPSMPNTEGIPSWISQQQRSQLAWFCSIQKPTQPPHAATSRHRPLPWKKKPGRQSWNWKGFGNLSSSNFQQFWCKLENVAHFGIQERGTESLVTTWLCLSSSQKHNHHTFCTLELR